MNCLKITTISFVFFQGNLVDYRFAMISSHDKYHTLTINIESRSFLRYPFLISALVFGVIHLDYLIKIKLVKTFDLWQRLKLMR